MVLKLTQGFHAVLLSSCAVAGSYFSFDCASDPLLNKDTEDTQGTVIAIDEPVLQYIEL